MEQTSDKIAAADFFVLRAPRLPLSALERVRAEYETSGRLVGTDAVSSPTIREAIFLASQNLYDAAYGRPDGADRRVDLGLARYVYRMATRSTPYGTFAGVCLGEITASTNLTIGNAEEGRRECRIDQGVLTNVQSELTARLGQLLREMPLSLNTSMWSAPDGFRYVEGYKGKAWTQYRLSAIKRSAALSFVVDRISAQRLSFAQLAAELSREVSVEESESEAFLKSLIDAKFLLPDVQLASTGSDVIARYVEEMNTLTPDLAELTAVSKATAELANVGTDPQDNIRHYTSALAQLERVGDADDEVETTGPEVAKSVQVDLHWAAARPTLSADLVTKLVDQLAQLRPLLVQRGTMLDNFIGEFESRYGSRWLPLIEVLDQDLGVPFGFESRAPSPLLQNVALPRMGGSNRQPPRDIDMFLQSWVQRAVCRREHEHVLIDDDLSILPETAPFPSTVSVLGCLSKEDDIEEPVFTIESMFGPPAVALLGRFSCGSPDMEAKVREFIGDTEGRVDDAIVAELAHQPDGRVGNVILRPTLREYEIEYLGRSGLPRDHVIPASDLLVTVSNGRVFLYSERLGKRIIPRISNAHNFSNGLNVPIYRFIGALQRQDEGMAGWHWGAALNDIAYLPALRYRNIRLARERWSLPSKLAACIAKEPEQIPLDMKRKLTGVPPIPSRIRVVTGDNFLELDLDRKLDREMFAEECRRSQVVTMQAAPSGEELARDQGGASYRHEIVLPLRVRHPAADGAAMPAVRHDRTRVYAPGSSWLYTRIFCGPAVADRIIADEFLKLRAFALEAGCGNAFFIRYNEGGYHLRVRVKGDAKVLWGPVREFLDDLLAPLIAERSVSRVEHGTYQPEYFRYGDIDGCEEVFAADSLATAQALALMLPLPSRDISRWQFAALSLLDLVRSRYGNDYETLPHLEAIAEGYRAEFNVARPHLNELNAAFRRHRQFIEKVISGDYDFQMQAFDDLLEPRRELMGVLRARLSAGAPGMGYPIETLSLYHMTANRIFPEVARQHELVLGHLLAKGMRGLTARRRYEAASETAAVGPVSPSRAAEMTT